MGRRLHYVKTTLRYFLNFIATLPGSSFTLLLFSRFFAIFVFPKGKQAISWWLMFITCSVLLFGFFFLQTCPYADCGSDGHYIVGYYPSWMRSSLQNITWNKIDSRSARYGTKDDDTREKSPTRLVLTISLI